MPKHLRVVVALMVLGLLARITSVALLSHGSVPALQWASLLVAVSINIGLIKGFVSRSVIAWNLAKVLAILGLIAAFLLPLPMLAARKPLPWALLWLVATGAQIYGVFVLFSREVRRYFRERDPAEGPSRRDSPDNTPDGTCQPAEEV